MKRIGLVLLVMMLPILASAQKYACVNTEYILSNVPEYSKAQAQLDKYSEGWQKELETKFQEIDKLYKTYQQEAYLLPDNLKRKREDEIIAKEREAKELQSKYFGPNGELDKKRGELMKPIQDRVYSMIERVANEKGYAFIFDKSGSPTLLYSNSKYDLSDQILEMMGIQAGSQQGTDSGSGKKAVNNSEMRRP